MASGRGILRRLEAEKGNPAPMVQPPCALRDGGLREARGEPLGVHAGRAPGLASPPAARPGALGTGK